MKNQLSTQKSPYLLAHAMNPVWWQPWNDQALESASQLGKPILLSIGYSACHWCHVMAEESFSDSSTADLMNDLFFCIKLDKEERPDIDAIYQSALESLGGRPGWPLTIILTPNLEPYIGGTYFPPVPKHGLPAFKDFLTNASQLFVTSPEDAKQKGSDLLAQIRRKAASTSVGAVSNELLNFVSNGILENFDPVYGGFGQDAKFPQTGLIENLWSAHLRTGHSNYRTAVIETLSSICNRSLFDHVRGGFFRYTVDDAWSVPHFEKMLYDNALLVSLLSTVHKFEPLPVFEDCTTRTCEWLIREMQLSSGGFASSLSADSPTQSDPNVLAEGIFYTCTSEEIQETLQDNSQLANQLLNFCQIDPVTQTFLVNKADKKEASSPNEVSLINEILKRFSDLQDHRIPPGKDNKVLTDWNGLVIRCLVDAGTQFERLDWLDVAIDTYQYISSLAADDGSFLAHCSIDSEPYGAAILDDYANMAQAALSLYELTGDDRFVTDVINWVNELESGYCYSEHGGYLLSKESASKFGYSTARETATPSGNGTMVGVLSRLFSIVGDDVYRSRAESILSTFAEEIPGHYLVMATLINNSELLENIFHVSIIGPDNNRQRSSLIHAARQTAPPNLMVIPATPEISEQLSNAHPAHAKTMVNGECSAYICVGNTCFPPVSDPDELSDRIKELSGLAIFPPT